MNPAASLEAGAVGERAPTQPPQFVEKRWPQEAQEAQNEMLMALVHFVLFVAIKVPTGSSKARRAEPKVTSPRNSLSVANQEEARRADT